MGTGVGETGASFQFTLGLTGMMYIIVALVCITLAWMGLQQLRLEVFLKNPKGPYAKVLLIFASIALGYEVASFLIAYVEWTGMLKGLF